MTHIITKQAGLHNAACKQAFIFNSHLSSLKPNSLQIYKYLLQTQSFPSHNRCIFTTWNLDFKVFNKSEQMKPSDVVCVYLISERVLKIC